MLIEGKNAVRQAIEAKTTINKIMVDKNLEHRKNDILALASKNRIKVEYLPKNILDKKSVTKHHQGFIAESVDFQYSTLEDLLENAKDQVPFFVILSPVESVKS